MFKQMRKLEGNACHTTAIILPGPQGFLHLNYFLAVKFSTRRNKIFKSVYKTLKKRGERLPASLQCSLFSSSTPRNTLVSLPPPPSRCWLGGPPVRTLLALGMIYVCSVPPTPGLALEIKLLPGSPSAARPLSGFAERPSWDTYRMSDTHDGADQFVQQIGEMLPHGALRGNIN